MIYTEQTKKAIRIMFDAHKNQVDKSNIPYVFHPFHLAEQMADEGSTIVALLHDVVEDTDITIENIRNYGFNDEVCTALSLLNHDDNVPYMDYIVRIKQNPVATVVKIADLKHNSDLTRLLNVTENDIKRVEKYREALALLTAE